MSNFNVLKVRMRNKTKTEVLQSINLEIRRVIAFHILRDIFFNSGRNQTLVFVNFYFIVKLVVLNNLCNCNKIISRFRKHF